MEDELLELCKKISIRIKNIDTKLESYILKKFVNELDYVFQNIIDNIKINLIFNQYGLYQTIDSSLNINSKKNEIIDILENKKLSILLDNKNVEYKNLKLQYIEDTRKIIEYFYQKYVYIK